MISFTRNPIITSGLSFKAYYSLKSSVKVGVLSLSSFYCFRINFGIIALKFGVVT